MNFDGCKNIVMDFCKIYKLNNFHKVALLKADYSDKYQVEYVSKNLDKIVDDKLAISGFIEYMTNNYNIYDYELTI